MEEIHAEGKNNVTLSAIIVRACTLCGEKREQGKDCESCGNVAPPEVIDLGVIAARHGNDPLAEMKWQLFGRRAAERRVRQANRELEHGDDG